MSKAHRKARPAEPLETTTLDTVAAEDMAEVRAVALREAKDGRVPAMAIVERMWRRRDRPVVIDLPPITDAASLADAQARVIAAAASGKITPRQALAFATLLEWRRRAMEAVEFERELEEIEAASAARAAQEAEQKARR
jgi:hypothetical protein